MLRLIPREAHLPQHAIHHHIPPIHHPKPRLIVRHHNARCPVLILTTYNTDADVLRAIDAGACGYLLKDAPPAELMAAVEAAARGEQVLSSAVAGRLMSLMTSPATSLTARELDVLTHVAAGRANREIAKILFVSEATVKTHLVHINEKLHTTSRTDAVATARELGIIR